MSLQLAPFVGRTCALVSVTDKYGRIRSTQTSPHQVESAGSQQRDDFLNLEHERDQERYREGSMHTARTSRSRSRGRGHVSQRQDDNKAMQREIDDLKKKLRRVQRKRSPSSSDVFSNDEEDASNRQRLRTPLSESFSCDEEHYHQRKYKSPPRNGVRNDVMSKALNQIFKSHFTRKIEGAKLPRRFLQLTFTIYNGRTDPIEHMSQFN